MTHRPTPRAVTLDSVARKIAADAGVAWSDLPDHPGYARGRWRDDARWLISRAKPDARFIDGERQWDGKTTEDLVDNFSGDDLRRAIEASHRGSIKSFS